MKVVYTPLSAYAPRTAASVNDIYTAIASASGSVEADNFAEAGIRRSAMSQSPVVRRSTINDNVRSAIAAPGAFASYTQAVQFRTGALGALAAGEALRVVSYVWAETTVNAGVGYTGEQARFRHAWNDGGATAAIVGSERQLELVPVPGAGTVIRHGTWAIESWLVGPLANVAWIELQHARGAGTLNASVSWLTVDLFRRLTVI